MVDDDEVAPEAVPKVVIGPDSEGVSANDLAAQYKMADGEYGPDVRVLVVIGAKVMVTALRVTRGEEFWVVGEAVIETAAELAKYLGTADAVMSVFSRYDAEPRSEVMWEHDADRLREANGFAMAARDLLTGIGENEAAMRVLDTAPSQGASLALGGTLRGLVGSPHPHYPPPRNRQGAGVANEAILNEAELRLECPHCTEWFFELRSDGRQPSEVAQGQRVWRSHARLDHAIDLPDLDTPEAPQ